MINLSLINLLFYTSDIMKKNVFSILLISALFLTFTGCQTMQDSVRIMGVGGDSKYDMSYLKANLKEGVTTSEQVIELFGQPNYQESDKKGPVSFTYDEGKTKSNALLQSAMSTIGYGNVGNTVQDLKSGKQRSLVIFFKNNKVYDFYVKN